MKQTLLTLFILLSVRLFAPVTDYTALLLNEPVNPYKMILEAIGKTESNQNTLAYNPKEEATGYFQIRPVRLLDYNQRTGNDYTMQDLFDYKVSEKIFLYYASRFEPWDYEGISRDWNKSVTDKYWKLIKDKL
jgi:hypothetical protein